MKARHLLVAAASIAFLMTPALAQQQRGSHGSTTQQGAPGGHQGTGGRGGHGTGGQGGQFGGQGGRGTGGQGGQFGGRGGQGTGGQGTGRHAPGRWYPKGAPTWQQFQHNQSGVRVHPRRYQGTVFPTPNKWRGDIGRFSYDRWHGGKWRHDWHNGRLGWWWVIGPSWYFYNAPVYPYPDSYTPPGEMPGWWYWCDEFQDYYPYVTYCPGGWDRVLPRD